MGGLPRSIWHVRRPCNVFWWTWPGERLLESAHDCSEGGLAVTLAECCFDSGGIGADIDVPSAAGPMADVDRLAATLFGESASRVSRA